MSLLPDPKFGTVKDVAESIIMAQQEGALGRTIFFIGAGCSVSAGVPAVPEIAQRMAMEIAAKFRTCNPDQGHLACYTSLLAKDRIAPCFRGGYSYRPDTPPTDSDVDWYKVYDACFDKHFRSPDDVRSLFGRILKECDGAVNWAHLCLGELAAEGYISTILTTNFDQLVLTGMANAGLLPVVCDGLEALNRLSSSPSHPQLVELHGSRHTYRLRNRPADVAYVAGQPTAISSIIGLFNTATTFVAVGYGGREDGVMDLLIEAARTYPDKNLYWVTRASDVTNVGEKVRTFLSQSVNSAIIAGQDADRFFLDLCTEMGIGAPAAVREPLARYRGVLVNLRKAQTGVGDIDAEMRRAEELLLTLGGCEQKFLNGFSERNVAADIRGPRLRGRFGEAYDVAKAAMERYGPRDAPREVLEEFIKAANAYAFDLSGTDLATSIAALQDSLSACEKLVSGWEDREAMALFAETLRVLGSAHLEAGDAASAKAQYERALSLSRRIQEKTEDDVPALQTLADSHQALGDVLIRSGDLAAAVASIESSLDLRKRLVELKPDDSSMQQDLSVAYDRLGDAKRESGDLASARTNYEAALAVDERLARADPADLGRQRNLGIAMTKMGDLLTVLKDYPAAVQRYDAALEIHKRLLSDNPTIGEYRRDLSVVYNRYGDLELYRGNTEAALEHYKLSLGISRELADTNVGSAVARSDVSASLVRLGQAMVEAGQFDAARTHLEEAMRISQELVERDPSNSQYSRNLALIIMKLGDLMRAVEDFEAARRHYAACLQIAERNARTNSSSAEVQRDYYVAMEALADLEALSGDHRAALKLYQASAEIAARLALDNPEYPQFAEDVELARRRIAQLEADLAAAPPANGKD